MKEEFKYTNQFNDELHGHKWVVKDEEAILLLVTGMAEHSSRYNHFASFLNENKISVYCLDHYGQGKNGKLGNPGKDYFFKMEATIDELINKFKKESKKVYLFAHSMGSFITQGYIQEYKGNLDKVVLCGSNGKTILFKLGNFLAHLVVNKNNYDQEAGFLYKLAIGAYEKPFINESKSAWISRNKENVKKYDEDPLSGFNCTDGFYYEFLKGLSSLHNKNKMKQINKNLPILIIGGKEDPVGNYSKGLLKLQKEYLKYGLNAQLIIYENMRHEILNEENNQIVYQDIINFLNS